MRWIDIDGSRRLSGGAVCALALALLLGSAGAAAAQGGVAGWTEPINFSQGGELIANQPQLLCDPLQNTHMFWVARGEQAASINYSTDASGTWREPIDIAVADSINVMNAAITPDLQAHLVWVTGVTGDLMRTSAPLAGAANAREWQTPAILDTGVSAMSEVYAANNALIADSAGRLHLVYSKRNDTSGFANSLYYLRSDNSGASWSEPVLITTVNSPESARMSGNLAADGEGRLHVAWDVRSDQYGSFSRLGYNRSTDDGATWSSEMVLAEGQPPFGAAMAAVFAFGDDEVHLTWDIPDRLHQWSNDGGLTWSKPVTIVALGAAYGGFNKLAKDSAGTLHAISAVREGVFHEVFNGAWAPPENFETRSFDPHGQQFVVCQGNRLHVAYFDRISEQEVWYSTKTVNAAELPRMQLPVAAPPASSTRSTPERSPTRTPEPAARATAPAFAFEGDGAQASGSLSPFLGVGASLVLVLGVVVVTLARRR